MAFCSSCLIKAGIIVAVCMLIIFIVLKFKRKEKIEYNEDINNTDNTVNNGNETTTTTTAPTFTKEKIEEIAKEIKADIYKVSFGTSRNVLPYSLALNMNESQLKYLVAYYRTIANDSLVNDMKGEFYYGAAQLPTDKLISKIKNLN